MSPAVPGLPAHLDLTGPSHLAFHATQSSGRMLKNPSDVVLGSSKSSTYPREYASGLDSPAALPGTRRVLARGGWAGEKSAFLSILLDCSSEVPHVQTIEVLACHHSISAAYLTSAATVSRTVL